MSHLKPRQGGAPLIRDGGRQEHVCDLDLDDVHIVWRKAQASGQQAGICEGRTLVHGLLLAMNLSATRSESISLYSPLRLFGLAMLLGGRRLLRNQFVEQRVEVADEVGCPLSRIFAEGRASHEYPCVGDGVRESGHRLPQRDAVEVGGSGQEDHRGPHLDRGGDHLLNGCTGPYVDSAESLEVEAVGKYAKPQIVGLFGRTEERHRHRHRLRRLLPREHMGVEGFHGGAYRLSGNVLLPDTGTALLPRDPYRVQERAHHI